MCRIGLGLLLAGARRVDDELFFAAAGLADHVTDVDLAQGRIFPPVTRLRHLALAVAAAVATAVYTPHYL